MQKKLHVITQLFNISVNKLAPDAKISARCKLGPVYSNLNICAVTHPSHIKKFKTTLSGACNSLLKNKQKICKIGKQMARTSNSQ